MNLFRSGENLEQGAIDFIESHTEIVLFSAYLKLNELKTINKEKKIRQIIVRWDIEDLCRKVSDIELYDYCLENKIALYRNTRIHLKALWNNRNDVFFGSANVTNKGLGEKDNFNYELNGIAKEINIEDKSYLNRLILDSEYVDEKLYKKLSNLIKETDLPTFNFPSLPTPPPTVDYFLINQLPMTSTPLKLYKIYSGEILDDIEMNCGAHDMELYRIPKGLDFTSFQVYLGNSFNQHPFIIKFKEAIKSFKDEYGRTERDGSMKFGTVSRWFSENTTTVPVPRPYDLTNYIQILYSWICEFDPYFSFDIPGTTSQVIKYKS